MRTQMLPASAALTMALKASSQGPAAALMKSSVDSAILKATLKPSSQDRAAAALMKSSVAPAVLAASLKPKSRDREREAPTLVESAAPELARTLAATGPKPLGPAAATSMSEPA